MAQPMPAPSPATSSTTPPVEKPFSLAPAIFTPFTGFSPDPAPANPQERLETILRNLERQHDAVRKNMVFLIEQQAKNLVARAQAELDSLREAGVEEEWEAPQVRRQEMQEMMRRVRAKVREGAKGEEYEFKKGDFDKQEEAGGNADVAMGGMGDVPGRRNAARIRYEIGRDLRELVEKGVREMEVYDVHTAETMKVYKEALERVKRSGKFTSGTMPRTGILKNRNEEIMVDNQGRRMSTGIPIAGLPLQGQPIRTFENHEGFARRSSK